MLVKKSLGLHSGQPVNYLAEHGKKERLTHGDSRSQQRQDYQPALVAAAKIAAKPVKGLRRFFRRTRGEGINFFLKKPEHCWIPELLSFAQRLDQGFQSLHANLQSQGHQLA